MVSDFIEERDGYLAIPDVMYETMKQHDPTISQSARVVFEYGKTCDGYWNNQLFMEQMEVAVKVAEAKYPPCAFIHVWIFDHSCGHTAFAPDALVATRLNHKPGGKQPAMRDSVGWQTTEVGTGRRHTKRSSYDFGGKGDPYELAEIRTADYLKPTR